MRVCAQGSPWNGVTSGNTVDNLANKGSVDGSTMRTWSVAAVSSMEGAKGMIGERKK
jgi:hypothetical protein